MSVLSPAADLVRLVPSATTASGDAVALPFVPSKRTGERPLRVVSQEPVASSATYHFAHLGKLFASRVDDVLAKTFEKLAEVSERMPDWTGLETPPSQTVYALAKVVRRQLANVGLLPDRIVPSADGEIVYYFFVEDEPQNSALRFASITCAEDGELVLLRADRAQGLSEVSEFSTEPHRMRAALDSLAEFIGTCLAQ